MWWLANAPINGTRARWKEFNSCGDELIKWKLDRLKLSAWVEVIIQMKILQKFYQPTSCSRIAFVFWTLGTKFPIGGCLKWTLCIMQTLMESFQTAIENVFSVWANARFLTKLSKNQFYKRFHFRTFKRFRLLS